jgi:hypothetical protein
VHRRTPEGRLLIDAEGTRLAFRTANLAYTPYLVAGETRPVGIVADPDRQMALDRLQLAERGVHTLARLGLGTEIRPGR